LMTSIHPVTIRQRCKQNWGIGMIPISPTIPI
jgi:hypothetical protein